MKFIPNAPFDSSRPGPGGECYVVINNHLYLMKSRELKAFLRICKNALKGKGIYCVKKDYLYEIRKDVYSTKEELTAAAQKWKGAGFTVYTNCKI